MNEVVNKPWGTYQNLLDSTECKVKKIVINPDQRPSYQYHFKRSEIWTVVSGVALITIDGIDKEVTEGEVVKIPLEAKHRIKNIGTKDLIFIEVQVGSYFGEDDIIRIEDDYGR